jgi:hypothetical protein
MSTAHFLRLPLEYVREWFRPIALNNLVFSYGGETNAHYNTWAQTTQQRSCISK